MGRTNNTRRRAILIGSTTYLLLGHGAFALDASWLAPVSGSWTDPTKWTSNPAIPSSSLDRAWIAAAGPTYTVLRQESLTLDQLIVDSAAATLRIDQGTFTALGGIQLSAGTIELAPLWSNAFPTIANTVISGSGAVSVAAGEGARLSTATLGCALNVASAGTLQLRNSLALDAGTISLSGSLEHPSMLYVSGTTTFLRGNGDVIFSGDGRDRIFNSGGTFTVESGITIRTGVGAGTIGGSSLSARQTINYGRFSAQTPGRTLFVDGFHNAGTLAVSNNSTLYLKGDWANIGTIDVGAGTLHLGGTFSSSSLAGFNYLGGRVSVVGAMQNDGTLQLNSQTGSWDLSSDPFIESGKITGGTLSTSDGAELVVPTSATGRLQEITIAEDARLRARGQLRLETGVVLNGAHFTIEGGQVYAPRSAVFDGTADVVFDGLVQGSFTAGNLNIEPATIGPSIVIRTGSGGGSVSKAGGTLLQSQAFISAETAGTTIDIYGGQFQNFGTIRAIDGGTIKINNDFQNFATLSIDSGTLVMANSFALADLGTFTNSGGSVRISGTLNNNAMTLNLQGPLNSLHVFDGGRIQGGTLTTTESSQLIVSSGSATLDSVDIQPSVEINAAPLTTVNLIGTSVNAATVQLNSATFAITGPASNAGTIHLNASTMTTSGAWSNTGPIHVDASTLSLGGTFSSSALTNLSGPNTTQIQMKGFCDNNNSTLTLLPVGTWSLLSGRLQGGRIESSTGTPLHVASGTLDGITAATDILVTAVNALFIENGLTLDQSEVLAPGSNIFFIGAQTLGGEGTVTFSSSLANTGGTLTIGPGISARSGPTGGNKNLGDFSTVSNITNNGTISAQSTTLLVRAIVENVGTMEARDGGNLGFIRPPSNVVSLNSLVGGTFAVYNASAIDLIRTILTNDATIILSGPTSSFTAVNSLRTNLGSFNLLAGRAFETAGSFTNSGDVVIDAGSVLDINAELVNTGTIDLNGAMIVNYESSSPLVDLAAQVEDGWNGGAWNGQGIRSSMAQTNSERGIGIAEAAALGIGSFAGQTVDATAVVLMQTFFGDANLDGKVNLIDFNNLAGNFGTSGKFWFDGDFDYDGDVDSEDFNRFAGNYGKSLPAPGPGALVPEPLTGIFTLTIPLFLQRRRQNPV